ncbi:hypothetical protein PVL29_013436 [Vitis rotundifolia]|uniref:Ethylene-responsive nuclear family protein n=1 Tax=Vitis rotundifolia TaxID=103349 RepID=A0AA38ZLF2_VITRO|nr:hypothetical protein PVL29_013436 [Vitis rotundifolia]
MPLPWKNARVGRISRFVADLQSPKRGGSLVVETGFPTSLIDLFVKNRDRLKKPRKRRSRVSDPVPQQPVEPQRRPESVQAPASSDSFSEIRSVECEEEEIGGIDGGSLVDGVGEVEESVGRPSGRGVTVAVLKMSVVVILALGTKKLAVGITMSAFLLLFLEYAAKWVFGLLTPCSDAQIAIKSLIPKVFPFLLTKQTALNPPEAPTPRTLSNASVEEIQIAESQFDFPAPVEETREIQEIQMGRPKIDFPAGERRWGCTEVKEREGDKEKEEEIFEALEPKHRHSRSARLKAKIKKYIPKKIQRRGPDSSNEVSSCMGGDKPGSFEEEDEEEEVEEQDDEDKSFQPPPLEEEKKLSEEPDMNGASCSSDIQSQNDVEAAVVRENPKKEIGRNSGYLVLFLIVLAGLLGGRVLALLLTTACCLMLKLFKKPITLLT